MHTSGLEDPRVPECEADHRQEENSKADGERGDAGMALGGSAGAEKGQIQIRAKEKAEDADRGEPEQSAKAFSFDGTGNRRVGVKGRYNKCNERDYKQYRRHHKI